MIDKKFVLLDLFGHFTEAEQGQADGGVLMAQNGSLVYYALIVNNVFALYRTMQGATVPSGTKFPLTQANLNAITAFAAAHGQPPVIDSEALAVEIKTSWVEAAGLADANKFIQMKAIVPTYDKSNPNDWVPNGTKTVTLAMVGMHVVGSTGSTNPANPNHGHPELLWATFEHVSNDPAAQYTYCEDAQRHGHCPAEHHWHLGVLFERSHGSLQSNAHGDGRRQWRPYRAHLAIHHRTERHSEDDALGPEWLERDWKRRGSQHQQYRSLASRSERHPAELFP